MNSSGGTRVRHSSPETSPKNWYITFRRISARSRFNLLFLGGRQKSAHHHLAESDASDVSFPISGPISSVPNISRKK